MRKFSAPALMAIAILFAAAPACAEDGGGVKLRYASMEQPVETVTVIGERRARDNDYKLGPTDKVRVTVYNEEDLSGEFQIDGSGFVRLPLIGQVKAQGLSAHELEIQVERAFDDGYLKNPRVNIEVTTYRPFYIIGQVTRPGEYPYVSNMSALNAVATAGGYTDNAIETVVYVRHEGETTEHEVEIDETTKVRPGDVVRVPRTMFSSILSVVLPVASLAYPFYRP